MLTCRTSFLETGIPAIGRLELLSAEQGLAAILFCDERRSSRLGGLAPAERRVRGPGNPGGA